MAYAFINKWYFVNTLNKCVHELRARINKWS